MTGSRAASLALIFWLGFAGTAMAAPPRRQVQPGDNDQTLRALHDEMERSKARLAIPDLEKPFYIEYRLLDLDIRSVTASFGALVSSSTQRARYMSVDVRVGDYHFDSSNFISDEGFRGFLGSTGQVGIDRDYSSLRQDLWLATDQAYKEALDQLARKRAFLRSLAKPPEIDDFSQEPPVTQVDARLEPDWTKRDWDAEAKSASAAFANYPQLYGSRIQYYLVYATTYLATSEGTLVRTSRSLAAIEAAINTQADDGMALHNFYSVYVSKPTDLPGMETVRGACDRISQELVALRAAAKAPDYVGPVLFEAGAAGPLLAQMLGPSLSGARPPLSMLPLFDRMMDQLGGKSEWSGRLGTRVLPSGISLVDDPTAKEFQGQPLVGGYAVDDEGVRAQRVELVTDGLLKNLLMSRRPGPEFDHSNGHGRSALLSDPRPASSNLFFTSTNAVPPAELKKRFLDACRADNHPWCLVVRKVDNPALAAVRQEDFSEIVAGIQSGLAEGDRLPLLVYKVYVEDGHEELVRGASINRLDLRALRSLLAVGNDYSVYPYMQSLAPGAAGTSLGAFGTASGGLPSDMIAPSFVLEDVDFSAPRGGTQRPPLLPPPPLR